MQEYWATRESVGGASLLHFAVAMGSPAPMVSVLLAAGAREMDVNGSGASAAETAESRSEVIAQDVLEGDTVWEQYAADAAVLCRMLRRGPAFRARSFAWPCLQRAGIAAAAAAAPGACTDSSYSFRNEARPRRVSVSSGRSTRRATCRQVRGHEDTMPCHTTAVS